MIRRTLLAALLASVPLTAFAGSETGSAGCTVVTQAAVDGAMTRIQSDDSAIPAPKSVTEMSCLDKFFSGFGLNLITSLLDPASLIDSVEGKICNLVNTTWNSLMGGAQCGLTISGFDIGFGTLGFGVMCPSLSFGGGGPTWASVSGSGVGYGGNGLYINGSPIPPTGYTAPATAGTF